MDCPCGLGRRQRGVPEPWSIRRKRLVRIAEAHGPEVAMAAIGYKKPKEEKRMRNEVRIVIRTGAIELEAYAIVEAETPEAAQKLVRETLHDDYLTTVETVDVSKEG